MPERAFPLRMTRIAVVVPSSRVREVLVTLAELGAVDLAGPLGAGEGPALEALRRLERHGGAAPTIPTLAPGAPDVEQLERGGASDLLAGEVELERRRASGVEHGSFALFVGWAPEMTLDQVGRRLEPLNASLVLLPAPRRQDPPTLLAPARAADPFRPLLDTYGAVPYADVDPTPFVAVTYCLMFGMMFGDVGDGLVLLAAALALRASRRPRLAALRRAWPLLAACAGTAILFGVFYGELFGPTHVLPTIWLAPLDDPEKLIAAGLIIGVVLLCLGHAVGIVNRWREGGVRLALTSASAVPGLLLLLAAAALTAGVLAGSAFAVIGGGVLVLAALTAVATGLVAETGRGAAAAGEVLVGSLETLQRTLSNVLSFTRLAAFGLVHAALGAVVLKGAEALWGAPLPDLAAVLVFALGSSLAFALEGLVAGVQALRLEYYELFSRVFAREGRPFKPWRLSLLTNEEV